MVVVILAIVTSLLAGPRDQSALPSRVLLWGPAAVEHHKTCRSLGTSLWKQPSVGDILRLLDRDRVMRTVLHFPQKRRLLPPEVREVKELSLQRGCCSAHPSAGSECTLGFSCCKGQGLFFLFNFL